MVIKKGAKRTAVAVTLQRTDDLLSSTHSTDTVYYGVVISH